jgi:catechol 2,3-dioxygenase-like lactoylglutathione lyase family enzyme
MKRIGFSLFALFLCMPGTADEGHPGPRIVGISTVVFYSTDLRETSRFYRQLLRPPDHCSWCEPLFPRPGLFIGLTFDHGLLQGLTLKSPPALPPSNLLYEIVFATTNTLKEVKEYLTNNNLSIEQNEDPRDHHLVVLDPEGHRIGFTAFKRPPQDLAYPVLTSIPLRLIHAGFVVHDRAAEDRFYKDVLGFRLYWQGGRNEDQTDWVDMQVPDGADWIEYMMNVPNEADQHTLGVKNHFALGVPDIRAIQKQLLENGVTLTEEPKIGRDGKWQLNVFAPDDTRIEFMEFKPVQTPCCSEYTGPHPGPQR